MEQFPPSFAQIQLHGVELRQPVRGCFPGTSVPVHQKVGDVIGFKSISFRDADIPETFSILFNHRRVRSRGEISMLNLNRRFKSLKSFTHRLSLRRATLRASTV